MLDRSFSGISWDMPKDSIIYISLHYIVCHPPPLKISSVIAEFKLEPGGNAAKCISRVFQNVTLKRRCRVYFVKILHYTDLVILDESQNLHCIIIVALNILEESMTSFANVFGCKSA